MCNRHLVTDMMDRPISQLQCDIFILISFSIFSSKSVSSELDTIGLWGICCVWKQLLTWQKIQLRIWFLCFSNLYELLFVCLFCLYTVRSHLSLNMLHSHVGLQHFLKQLSNIRTIGTNFGKDIDVLQDAAWSQEMSYEYIQYVVICQYNAWQYVKSFRVLSLHIFTFRVSFPSFSRTGISSNPNENPSAASEMTHCQERESMLGRRCGKGNTFDFYPGDRFSCPVGNQKSTLTSLRYVRNLQ